MKPFDLAAALKGAPVVTRDGRGIKILSTEVGKSAILRGTVAGKEGTFGWYVDGKWSASGEHVV